MIRLLISDLREHLDVWTGVMLVAAAFGYVGGCFASFMATAMAHPGTPSAFFFKSAAEAILLFSSVSACAVLASTAQACIASLRRTYALWQLVNVSPRMVGGAVLGQMAIASVLGSGVGLSLCTLSLPALFEVLFSEIVGGAHIECACGVAWYPMVIEVSVLVAVAGGLRASRAAARVDPVVALRDERALEDVAVHMSPVRWIVAAGALGVVVWSLSTVDPALVATDFNQSAWLVMLPIAIPALLAAFAPVLLPCAMRALTCVPFGGNAWFLACREARHARVQGSSLEVPLVVAAGTVSGLYSMFGLMERCCAAYHLPIGSGFGLDPRLALVMFGGPVALAAVGVCANVLLALRPRERDASLLHALGADSATVLGVAALEAVLHVALAGFMAICSAALGCVLAAWALGLTIADAVLSVRIAPAALIIAAGFVLLLVAELLPVLRAIKGAPVLRLDA